MMEQRLLGGGNEAYYTRVTFRLYVEEADDDTSIYYGRLFIIVNF